MGGEGHLRDHPAGDAQSGTGARLFCRGKEERFLEIGYKSQGLSVGQDHLHQPKSCLTLFLLPPL